MIHHVSLGVRDPLKVAKVLAELMGGTYRPYLGPVRDGFMVMAEDDIGTAVEIYPEGAVMGPGQGETQQAQFSREAPGPDRSSFHFLLSVKSDRETVMRIGTEAGWRVLNCWRGPPAKPTFELIELWVENRFLIEVATKDMLPNYVRAHTAAAHDVVLEALRAVAKPA